MGDLALRISNAVGAIAARSPLRGAAIAARDGVDAVLFRLDRPPLRVAVDGLTLAGYLRHRHFLREVAGYAYEPMTREVFAQALTPGVAVIDGGAHIGLYSLLAARRLRRRAVFAFEPDPHNFGALVHNLRVNGCEAFVEAHRQALAAMAGSITFYASAASVSGSIIDRQEVPDRRRVIVDATTLAAVLGRAEAPRLVVKLDLEGGEIAALRGMGDGLGRRPAVLIIEYNPPALAQAGADAATLLAAIGRLGFRVFALDERSRTRAPAVSTSLRKGNLYCIRGDW